MPSRPRIGDKVYDENQKPQQPNGVVINIVWGCDDPVVVKFLEGTHVESYGWDAFHTFSDKFNQWMI